MQVSSKEIIVFFSLSTETEVFNFEEGQKNKLSITNISLLRQFFSADLVHRDGRKQRVTGSAQVYWEMCERAGEAMETLYIFQHPRLPLMMKKANTA